MLQVSSIPVMAAMRQLISEGLATQVPHHPPRVAPFSHEGLEEMTLIRMHLEVLATTTSVPHVGPEGLRALRGLLQEMDAALAEGDLPRYGALNKAFHFTIYEACPHRLLVQKIKELWDRTDRHGLRSMFTPEIAEASQADHRGLVECIEAGAAEEAGELTDRQKRRFRAVVFARAGTERSQARDGYSAGGDDRG
jgi:DNA-binding GntR family transcriptional regulator